MYSHILIATDGSELAQRGIDQGLALAQKLGGRVSILNVTEMFPDADVTFEKVMGLNKSILAVKG